MLIRHLNCGTLNFGGARFVCNTLLIETRDGLALVDTGFGLGDIARPERLGEQFLQNAKPKLDRQETALAQIEALGHAARDVRHIFMTHLDRDHAGGINDFPDALVHVHEAEYRCAVEGGVGVRPGRYTAAQWAATTKWRFFAATRDDWFGLPALRILPDETGLVAIPLPGHTPGHCGIAARTESGWLLHSGDSHYHHWQRKRPPQSPSPALDAFQKGADSDTPARIASQNEVCRLQAEQLEIDVICTHDPFDLDRYAGQE